MSTSISSNGTKLNLPPESDANLQAWLNPPAMGFCKDGKMLETPFSVNSGDDLCVGLGEASGLTMKRSQRIETGALILDMRAEAAADFHGISLRQSVDFSLPSSSYVVAPGAVYDGNRFLVSPQPYCPHIPTEGVTPNGPILIADVPRLASATGYHLELASNALTTPFLGIYDPISKVGVLVEIQIYGDWGVSGVTITTLPDQPVRVTFTLPVHRQQRYRICDWVAADEPGMDLAAGQSIEARLRIIPVRAENIPAFVRQLAIHSFEARDKGSLESRKNLGKKLREAADLVEAKFDRFNWVESDGFYRTTLPQSNSPWVMQSGWSGGAVTMRALIQSPDATRRERAKRMLSFLCTAATPSGYFHGVWNGKRWLSFNAKRPGCRAFTLVRRPLELGRDILHAMNVVEARGEALEPLWIETARRFLDAVVSTERRFGHLGYSLDPETGDVLWGDSTGGAFALEALAHGYRRFGSPCYLQTAKRLAAYYREHFLLRGFTCGGVGDALMAVDSESNYALMAGLVHLHEITRDPVHLEWAVEAADLVQTWTLLYDAKFPEGTPLQRLGIEPRGAYFANIQNQHGAPGIYVASGIELATLARHTGDNRFLELLREITGCIPQMVVKPGQDDVWGDLPVGSLSERLMTMDGLEPNGHTQPIDTFGNVPMMVANELPAELLN
jgi:hypothetical protein